MGSVEVAPRLFVGDAAAFELLPCNGAFAVVSAAKEPWHREALGYNGRGAPKDDPEYLVARRPNRLILNLIDGNDPAYVPDECINAALEFIEDHLERGHSVLVHCNQGRSRAAVIAMLYLFRHSGCTFDEAEKQFRTMCPRYEPARGMREYARAYLEARAC